MTELEYEIQSLERRSKRLTDIMLALREAAKGVPLLNWNEIPLDKAPDYILQLGELAAETRQLQWNRDCAMHNLKGLPNE